MRMIQPTVWSSGFSLRSFGIIRNLKTSEETRMPIPIQALMMKQASTAQLIPHQAKACTPSGIFHMCKGEVSGLTLDFRVRS